MSHAAGTTDTSPDVEAMMVERWRRMTPAEKLAVVDDLNDTCERLARAGARQRHPNATEHETTMRVYALRLGRDLMIQVYGWDPAERGW